MFQRTLRQTTWKMGRNFVAIGMEALLQYLLNILKVGVLEKVSISNTQNHKVVFQPIDCR